MRIILLTTVFISFIGCKSILYSQDSLSNNNILINDEFYNSIEQEINKSKDLVVENEARLFKEKYNRDSTLTKDRFNSQIDPDLINSLKKTHYLRGKKFKSIEVIETMISGEKVYHDFYIFFRTSLGEGKSVIIKFSNTPTGYDQKLLIKEYYGYRYEILEEFVSGLKNNFEISCIEGVYGMKIHFTTIAKKNNKLIAKSKLLNNPCNYHFEVLDKVFFKDFENY